MEGRQRRSFTDDYKRQAVDLVASIGRSIGSWLTNLVCAIRCCGRWAEHRGARREPSALHAAEIARLKRENERLRVSVTF